MLVPILGWGEAGGGEEIQFSFGEGIADLCDGADGSAEEGGAKVKGDGIEHVTEHSRKSEKENAGIRRELDAILTEPTG